MTQEGNHGDLLWGTLMFAGVLLGAILALIVTELIVRQPLRFPPLPQTDDHEEL